jgi:hypothetical protein
MQSSRRLLNAHQQRPAQATTISKVRRLKVKNKNSDYL